VAHARLLRFGPFYVFSRVESAPSMGEHLQISCRLCAALRCCSAATGGRPSSPRQHSGVCSLARPLFVPLHSPPC
jgi:hypothetical protein